MQRRLIRLSLAALVLVLLATALTAGGRDRGEFMFVDELQPGMQGTCKTVVKGDEISTFNFEVVGLIERPRVKWILVRVWGDAIMESGGISQGMSGSPCYIDSKLIGAISRVYVEDRFVDVTLVEERPHVLLTPIEYMLEVIDACIQKAETELVGTETGTAGLSTFPEGDTSDGLNGYAPLASPMMVGGLSARTFDWMASGIDSQLLNGDGAIFQLRGEQIFESFVQALTMGVERRYGLKLYPMAGNPGGTSSDPTELEPGSPIGAALMLGDVRAGILGTVTYIEEPCLVAFGHPFLNKGETDIPLTASSVLDTIRNVKWPFKLTFLGDEIGNVVEDRYNGVGAIIGGQAKTIQFNFTVNDKDTGRSNTFNVRSVTLPDWHWYLLLFAGIEAINQTIGRIGQGTLIMDMTINGQGMAGPLLNQRRLLQRHEIFVSDRDISFKAMLDPAWIDFILAWNEFTDPEISSIDLKMTVEKALKVKVVEGVEPEQQNIEAGSKLPYTVTLQAYRGLQETIKGDITIPDWASGSYICLEAFPARNFFWKYTMAGSWVRPWWIEQVTNLDELIKAIEDAPTNDLLIVTAYDCIYGRSAVYAYDIKSLGDWYVDGNRTSEGYVQVK